MNRLKEVNYFIILAVVLLLSYSCSENNGGQYSDYLKLVEATDKNWILSDAEKYLLEEPITITAYTCERSLGNIHDFYSEGDYWWPNSEDPDGPYICRDGQTNPENFVAHRKAMRRMSIQVATLTAAYKITHDEKYARKAIAHLKAWFVDADTRMNPSMRFAQAIKGIVPGRGVGLIDGIHLVEPARSVSILKDASAFKDADYLAVKEWYADFLSWMATHEYGIDERDRENNHGTCWVMQAAEYARLTDNREMTRYCIDRYKNVLLPNQMSPDGSFHFELKRTKPYGYSLFNVDAMGMICKILSNKNDLWNFTLPDGRGMRKGLEYIFPYIQDKGKWPLPKDVMYWDEWPARHPVLLFAGVAFNEKKYIELWKKLKPMPASDEGLRNFPIRVPILWL